jgi:hypothetical protein
LLPASAALGGNRLTLLSLPAFRSSCLPFSISVSRLHWTAVPLHHPVNRASPCQQGYHGWHDADVLTFSRTMQHACGTFAGLPKRTAPSNGVPPTRQAGPVHTTSQCAPAARCHPTVPVCASGLGAFLLGDHCSTTACPAGVCSYPACGGMAGVSLVTRSATASKCRGKGLATGTPCRHNRRPGAACAGHHRGQE